tara:strand:+ start:637 stop:792 length:156 start_codon:yes stop_codon:yes gene_type:complete
MTYIIQVLCNTEQQWEHLESFQDKELAEKEIRNLDRAPGTFRLIQTHESTD